jgi:hypothetical protein
LIFYKELRFHSNSFLCNSTKKGCKLKSILSLTLIAILAGCGHSSGTIKIGLDTYTISTSASWGKGGIPAAKRMAYEEAIEQCSRAGNTEVFTLSEKSNERTWTEGMYRFELNFRCLKANDPEFKRQNLKSSPDTIIENRTTY